jgi:glycosyltransferase involved in cell wall biosynthesis
MRIVICAAQVPFSRGGAEIHVEGLKRALIEAGHDVEIVALPFKWYPHTQLLKSALAWRMIDIIESNGRSIDLVICTKFPTWAVRHPNKIAWIIHQYRQAYDWFGTEYSDLTNAPDDLALRRRIQQIDTRGLGECRALFANSRNTAQRLETFNGMQAEPLHVPIQLNGLKPDSFEPFIFTVSRLDRAKRIDILINAFSGINMSGHLLVAGDGPERERLESLVERLELGDRVKLLGRISDEEVVDYYNRCRAVYYGPVDEDFGLVTVEAFSAGKPVITVVDSGGVLELVEHETTGLVADDPTPEAISPLIERLLRDEACARSLGAAGQELARAITWDRVVERLLGAAGG